MFAIRYYYNTLFTKYEGAKCSSIISFYNGECNLTSDYMGYQTSTKMRGSYYNVLTVD